jgi:hypothetical protein
MRTQSPRPVNPDRTGLWITLLAALAYCAWLAIHWLPLGYSDREMAGFVSRVWDVQREWQEHHHLAWWTPSYMSGSSYGLNHTQGFTCCESDLRLVHGHSHGDCHVVAGDLCGATTMYGCARYFLKNEWAAALAGIVYLLHPEQVIRAAGAEHLGIIVFMPFMPLTFWLFARALETDKFRDIFWCGLAAFGLLWTHNKMAFVHGTFLAGYLGYWLWRSGLPKIYARVLGVVTVGLCAVLIVRA